MDNEPTIDQCRRPIQPFERRYLKELGAELRSLRREATLAEVASASGLSIATISRLERGMRRPRRSTLALLAVTYSRESRAVWTRLVSLAGAAIAPESDWRSHQRMLPPGFTNADVGIVHRMGYGHHEFGTLLPISDLP